MAELAVASRFLLRYRQRSDPIRNYAQQQQSDDRGGERIA